MPRRAWEFELRGKDHTIELEHTHLTGRRSVWVDGKLIEGSKLLLDFRSESKFTVDGIQCVIQIKGSEFGDYKLYVGDNEIKPK